MRTNLTKKEIVNSLYMQIGFSKKISEDLLEDILDNIVENLIKHKKLKISNFGTFSLRSKRGRIGRKHMCDCRKAKTSISLGGLKTSSLISKLFVLALGLERAWSTLIVRKNPPGSGANCTTQPVSNLFSITGGKR